jgi:hypothetical protein
MTFKNGLENVVFYGGRLQQQKHIDLPEDWTDFVNMSTITISLTPIGSHQELVVRGIQGNRITIQSKSVIPIDCYYHVFAERNDVES